MDTPDWALILAYWLHMLATVVWIGGLAALSIFVLPAARGALEAQAYAKLLGEIQKRLETWGWFCLVVLAATGMLQMSANPNYQGFLALQSRWSVAILVKHILFLGMAGLSAYLTWGLYPRLRRLALQRALRGGEESHGNVKDWEKRQETVLLRVNLVLGLLILALTAVARAV